MPRTLGPRGPASRAGPRASEDMGIKTMVAYHADLALEPAGRTTDVSSQRPGVIIVQSNALGQGLHWGDYAVMAMYLVGTLGLGFIFRRRGADTEDYLLGGRRMPW